MSQAEPSVALKPYRIASVERLRIVAIFGIVWFHTESAVGRSIGYAGLPVFLLIFYIFSTRRLKPENFVPFMKKKANRLLKPWLFWVIVYTLSMLVKQMLQGSDISTVITRHMFFVGPKIHLWYLPFVFMSGLVVNVIHHRIECVSSIWIILFGTILGVLLLYLCSIILTSEAMLSIQLRIPVPQWIFALPSIPLGFAIARVYSSFQDRIRQQLLFYLGIVVSVETVCLLQIYFGYLTLVVSYSIAIVLVCVAFLGKSRCGVFLLKFSSLTLGIYLVHPFVGSILNMVGMRALNPWINIVTVFVLSSIVTMLLQKTPLKRFV